MNRKCYYCQYYRKPSKDFLPLGHWCSNSKSSYCGQYVNAWNHCSQFMKRGKKAPLWMRMLNRVLGGSEKLLKRKGGR